MKIEESCDRARWCRSCGETFTSPVEALPSPIGPLCLTCWDVLYERRAARRSKIVLLALSALGVLVLLPVFGHILL